MMRSRQWHNETDSRTATPPSSSTRPDSLSLTGRVILRILGALMLFVALVLIIVAAITWSQVDIHHTLGGLLIALGMGCVGFVAFSEWLQ